PTYRTSPTRLRQNWCCTPNDHCSAYGARKSFATVVWDRKIGFNCPLGSTPAAAAAARTTSPVGLAGSGFGEVVVDVKDAEGIASAAENGAAFCTFKRML